MNRGEVHIDTSPHCAFEWSEGVQLKYVTSGSKESVCCHVRSLKARRLTDGEMKTAPLFHKEAITILNGGLFCEGGVRYRMF